MTSLANQYYDADVVVQAGGSGLGMQVLVNMPKITDDSSLIDIIITAKFIFIIIFSIIFLFIFNFIVNIIILRSRNVSSFFKDFKNENDEMMK